MTEVTEDDLRRAERLWNSDVTVAVPRIARAFAELGAELERWKDTAQKAANEALSRSTNTDKPVTVTEDDRRCARQCIDNFSTTMEADIALVLAERRERAEEPWKTDLVGVQEARINDGLKIGELSAYIAELKAENAQLQDSLQECKDRYGKWRVA